MESLFRITVRSICIHKGNILLERMKSYSDTIYYFPSGEVEIGESFEDCLIREYSEETSSTITKANYLFVVENYFKFIDKYYHSIEHFFNVELNDYLIKTIDKKLIHSWVPLDTLKDYDVRPEIIKIALLNGTWNKEKHFSNIKSRLME